MKTKRIILGLAAAACLAVASVGPAFSGGHVIDDLEPALTGVIEVVILDDQGEPMLGDDGEPLTAFLDGRPNAEEFLYADDPESEEALESIEIDHDPAPGIASEEELLEAGVLEIDKKGRVRPTTK